MGWTFSAVTIAWVFFRADSVTIALEYLIHSAGNITSTPDRPSLTLFAFIMVLYLADFLHRSDAKTMFRIENRWLRWSAYSVAGFVIMQRFSNPANFIYFQF